MTASAGPAGRWPARENLAMAVPVSVTSTIWSRRPTVAGQSRSRNPHLHAGDHHALGAEPFDVLFQPVPGVAPRLADQFGPTGHLDVA